MRRLTLTSLVFLTTGCAGLLGLDDFTEGESSSAGGGSGSTLSGNPTSSGGDPTSSSSSTDGAGGGGDGGSGTGTGGDPGSGGSGGSGGTGPGPLAVTPGDEPKVGVFRSLQFSANVAAEWAVEEADGGTIDADGFYVSPPEPGTFHVVATAVDDPADVVSVQVDVVPLGARIFGGIPGGPGTIDGDSNRSRLVRVGGMAVLASNQDMIFSDSNANTLRRYDRQEDEVTTLAGVPFAAGAADGIGAAARFDRPGALVSAASGSRLFVADRGNFCVRDVNAATGAVTTLAGACGIDGSTDAATGAGARFEEITAMARSSDGASLYVCQSGNVRGIRRIEIATGRTETLITTGMNSCMLGVDLFNQRVYFVNGQDRMLKRFQDAAVFNAATVEDVAELPQSAFSVEDIALDTGFGGGRQLYTTIDGSIWRFEIDDAVFGVEPLLDATEPGYVDGDLTVAETTEVGRFITYPQQGLLFFADDAGYTIREIDLSQEEVSTSVGVRGNFEPVDGAKSVARMVSPFGAALDEEGNAYVVSLGEDADNTIRRIDGRTGAIDTFSGVRGFEGELVDGPADVARFGLLFDLVRIDDTLYALDAATSTIRTISLADGSVDTLAGRFQEPGNTDGVGAQAQFDFDNGAGMTTDGVDLYVADGVNHTIRKVDVSSGAVTTIAGGVEGSSDGNGLDAQFVVPVGLAFDRGSLFIADYVDHTIRQMDLATGDVTTVLGISGVSGEVNGGVGTATFNAPFRLAADGIGNLYVSAIPDDAIGGTIRRISLDDREVFPFAGDPAQLGLSAGPLPSTLGCPSGLIIDAAGDLLFGDRCDGAVVAVRPL